MTFLSKPTRFPPHKMPKGDSRNSYTVCVHFSINSPAQVYHPCILQTKKRYVGLMYESPRQSVPTLDAKGIESVRRDTCPAVVKMLEQVDLSGPLSNPLPPHGDGCGST